MVDAGLNAYVALHGGVRRLGLLHGAYGVGTSAGSLLVVGALAAGSWRGAWVVMAVDGAAEPRRPGLIIAVTVLCFAALVGAEYSTGAWSYTLLTDGRGVSDTAAGLWVAAFWGGLTVGRFAVGAVGHRIDRIALLNVSAAGALSGVGLLWWDPGGLGVLGLPVAGLGFAALFPALVALMPDRIGAHRSSAVIGWSVAAASLGGTAVAAGAGVLVDEYGAEVLGPTLFVVTAVFVAFHFVLVGLAPVTTPAAPLADPLATPPLRH
jgi:hypothetical protein